tara:strand:+ start:818 stop:1315 length:498 start_codon:yes stop_codon:yes gene_type:complete
MIKEIFTKSFLINLFVILLIFLVDRISKVYVIYLDNIFFGSEILTTKFLNITLIWNEGIAFGLLSVEKKNLYDILTFIILIIILMVFYMAIKSEGFKKYLFLMILGGAIGNAFDRIFYKAVPDFIDFHIQDFHWFIFNVADIFITLGVIFLITLEFIGSNNSKKL